MQVAREWVATDTECFERDKEMIQALDREAKGMGNDIEEMKLTLAAMAHRANNTYEVALTTKQRQRLSESVAKQIVQILGICGHKVDKLKMSHNLTVVLRKSHQLRGIHHGLASVLILALDGKNIASALSRCLTMDPAVLEVVKHFLPVLFKIEESPKELQQHV